MTSILLSLCSFIPVANAIVMRNTATGQSAISLLETARLIHSQRRQVLMEHNSNTVQDEITNDITHPDLYNLAGVSNRDMYDDLFKRQQSLILEETTATTRKEMSWTACLFDEDCSVNMDLLSDEETMTAKVKQQDIARLQAATGSEVVDMELNLQMEAARRRTTSNSVEPIADVATAFIDSHLIDATPGEKFAMRMIPLQLPAPVAALKMPSETSTTTQDNPTVKNTVTRKSKANMASSVSSSTMKRPHGTNKTMRKAITKESSRKRTMKNKQLSVERPKPPTVKKETSTRISREEEIQLATIIQQGARLNSIKSEFEAKHGRDITRAEWTELADLDSPSTLRRLVSSYRKAKNKLVTANMGLVYAVVRQGGYNSKKDVTEEELVQEGSLGLIRAAELFDPNKGLRFSTYATIWIKGMLGNSKVDQLIVVPDREKNKWKKVQKAVTDYTAVYGDKKQPTAADIAKTVKMKEDEVSELQDRMSSAKQILSLDYKYEGTSRSGTVEDKNVGMYGDKAFLDDQHLAEELQLKADVVAALARNLDPREARLMRLRYGLKDGKTRSMVECAEAMGLSRQRVQQLNVQCLKKLREADDAKSLQEYLLTVA